MTKSEVINYLEELKVKVEQYHEARAKDDPNKRVEYNIFTTVEIRKIEDIISLINYLS